MCVEQTRTVWNTLLTLLQTTSLNLSLSFSMHDDNVAAPVGYRSGGIFMRDVGCCIMMVSYSDHRLIVDDSFRFVAEILPRV
jgi:hypothetical protein